MEKIYNASSVNLLLGSLLNDSSLCVNDKYPLDKTDFCIQYQKIIFVSISNLYKRGTKNIGFMELDTYLSKYPEQHEVFKDCGGRGDIEGYLETICELADINNYESYYNDVRKLSCLRDYRDKGQDIEKFWDYNKSDDENFRQLDNVKIEDIIGHFELIQIQMNQKYLAHSNIQEMICGDGFDDVLDEFEKEPMLGGQIAQPMLNNVYRGWCKGHLIIEGAPSSFGKTLKGAMDLISVGSLKLYDKEQDIWYDNPYYQGKSCLIHSEQKSREEIQSRICSILAKVPMYTLLDGAYTKEEKERLSMAGKVLKDSEFKIINYPDFTSSGIVSLFKRLKLEGYSYIVQDYCWSNGYIISDMKRTMGLTNVTEQNALLHFANTLKVTSEQLGMACKSFMQLNDTYKLAEIIDESTLYCGRSVKTKVDAGHISTTPTPKQLAQVESLITKWNKKFNDGLEMIKPNVLSSVFKSRYGKFGENIKIWSYFDRDIGEITDMFATSADNIPIKIEPLYIERK